MKLFRISHSASAEFAEAVRWYEQKRSGLGGEFFDAVTHAIELIRTRPEIGAAAGRTRSWLLTRFPYRLIYRVRDEGRLHRRDCAHKPKTGLLAKPVVTIQSG